VLWGLGQRRREGTEFSGAPRLCAKPLSAEPEKNAPRSGERGYSRASLVSPAGESFLALFSQYARFSDEPNASDVRLANGPKSKSHARREKRGFRAARSVLGLIYLTG